MSTPISTTKVTIARGCDGPVVDRAADHLNRWPLAREVYGIATTGSKDWSVRIGIYGEWGSGKTSVLKFISSMAEKGGHIVIMFNPWEHSTKESLWRAFVLSIFAEPRLASMQGALKARTKGILGGIIKRASVVESVTAIINENAGKGVGAGLELVKSCFSFNRDDLKSLQEVLGEKRVIVLIDDLDRTARELVPEILFAMKELMDIPGFSFICAFDPVVVGEVLGGQHPGFGNGLNFLDKIIDYPRWLPPPTVEGLAKLALADAKISCPFVPETAIRDAIPLLPTNPRAVRQFVRILALLKPQIQRHSDSELSWPTIIAANILKVRYPRIAHELLGETEFWNSIGTIRFQARDKNEDDEISKALDEQIKKTCDATGVHLETSQQTELKAALFALTSQMGLFIGLYGESASYQFNIAEAPAAVTWKEFDQFLYKWEANQDKNTAEAWIASHASENSRTKAEVFREVLRAAVQRYAEVLHRADNVLVEAEKPTYIEKAKALFALLEALCLDLAEPGSIGYDELRAIVEKFASFANSGLPIHQQFWSGNEVLILTTFKKWNGDVALLNRVLEPYGGFLPRGFEGDGAGKLRNKLCALALPHFAHQVIGNFRESGFVGRLISRDKNTLDSRRIIWDANGLFGDLLRTETFTVLEEASSNRSVQENAFELLHWFILARTGQAPQDRPNMDAILSNQEIFDAIWNAAVTTQLGPRAVYHLKDLPEIAKTIGIKFVLPVWWQDGLVSAGIINTPTAAAAAENTQ
jgi:hypothetical protein